MSKLGEAFVPQQQESRGSDPLPRSTPATAAMAANDAGCFLLSLDTPADRSAGGWGAWASLQDQIARSFWDDVEVSALIERRVLGDPWEGWGDD